MGQYVAPVRDMQFVLHELLQVENELKQLPRHAEVDADIINQVLEEGGKFTAAVVFPLNHSGDREGCRLDTVTHEVTTPKGFKEAYRRFVEGQVDRAINSQFPAPALKVRLKAIVEERRSSDSAFAAFHPFVQENLAEQLLRNEVREGLPLPELREWRESRRQMELFG